MKKLFFICWGITLTLSVFLLLAANVKEIGRRFLQSDAPEGYRTGDMFRMSMIDSFVEYFPQVYAKGHGQLETADIITFGDSFLNCGYGSPHFPDILEGSTGLRVVNVAGTDTNPIDYLESVSYQKGKDKILIWEKVERLAFQNGQEQLDTKYVPRNLADKVRNGLRWRLDAGNEWVKDRLIALNNDNPDYQYFFLNSKVTYPLAKFVANFRFRFLDELHPEIGAYSMNPKMLFDEDSVTFNRRTKTKDEIDALAKFIAQTSRELKKRYNVQLIFAMVPNKYTVYHDFVRGDYIYDDFVPNLNQKLHEHGVVYADIYQTFHNYRATDDSQLLYFSTDTHWTPLGKAVFLKEIIKTMNAAHKDQQGVKDDSHIAT